VTRAPATCPQAGMDYARRLKVLADKHAADLVVVIPSTVPPQPLCRARCVHSWAAVVHSCAARLWPLSQVMRVYFEKPRTTVGWKAQRRTSLPSALCPLPTARHPTWRGPPATSHE